MWKGNVVLKGVKRMTRMLTLPGDAFTGLDLGQEFGLDSSKRERGNLNVQLESGCLSTKIIPFLNVLKDVGVCALGGKRSFGQWRKYSPITLANSLPPVPTHSEVAHVEEL
jgi:hypothetical protein